MRLMLLAGLLFAPVVQAESQLQVIEVHQPESPVWGTNTATITIRNAGATAREVSLSWHSANLMIEHGWGADDKATIGPGETRTLPLEFIMPAFPGKVNQTLRVRDAADNSVLWQRVTPYEFPFGTTHTGPLKLPARLLDALGLSKQQYPALQMARRGYLIIYFLEGDDFVHNRIDAIAQERARIYGDLRAKINPAFDSEIAIYLFPDADSKLAYTGHHGMGWAVGRILVEIYNQHERIDPYHEVTHIIAGSIGNPPAVFNEGLAAWMQDGHRWDGISADSWAKAFQMHGALWPVEKLFTFTEIGTKESRAEIAYPQSASLVGYLVERFGWEKFLEAYRTVKRKSDGEAFSRAFGITLAELEKDWLKKLSAPEVDPAPEAKVAEVLKKKP